MVRVKEGRLLSINLEEMSSSFIFVEFEEIRAEKGLDFR